MKSYSDNTVNHEHLEELQAATTERVDMLNRANIKALDDANLRISNIETKVNLLAGWIFGLTVTAIGMIAYYLI